MLNAWMWFKRSCSNCRYYRSSKMEQVYCQLKRCDTNVHVWRYKSLRSVLVTGCYCPFKQVPFAIYHPTRCVSHYWYTNFMILSIIAWNVARNSAISSNRPFNWIFIYETKSTLKDFERKFPSFLAWSFKSLHWEFFFVVIQRKGDKFFSNPTLV